MNTKVNWYFEKSEKWKDEISLLRKIILDCQLNEELKWGVPAYTYNKSNIVLIHTFKDYCAILFPKGVLMKDTKNILIQQTEHVQSARQIRFTNVQEITALRDVIKDYIFEACEVEDLGLKVELNKTKDYHVSEELKQKLDGEPAFKKAFEALTSGRQRAYLLYFSQAKQTKTRISRIEKHYGNIMKGIGLND